MADVNISKFRAQVVREGSKPATPGFVVSEGQNPVDPAGSGQNHLPVTIAPVSTGLAITESQVLGGAGTVAQYIRGDGSLADFPATTGGGSSVSYYLNGSVSQGTIGGVAYLELNRMPIFGAGTDFTRNSDGYIASFITDAGDPNKLEIPAGNWNLETYFSASSGGGNPTFYVELYKYNGTTFTLIASNSGSPELIAFGTNLNPYFSTLAVPQTTLALTDRLALRYYVTTSGRTITLHTENDHLCQVITTFTTGLTALNGLTTQVQFFAVGTSGTDFNISSSVDTHTFNIPTASATNRGALSSTDWTTFNNKENAITAGTTAQYFRGDKTFQTLNTSVVPEGTNLYYTEARVNANTNVAANTAARHNAVTLGTANGLSLSTQVLSLGLASAGVTGALSGTDWTTFNGKQNSLTLTTTGTSGAATLVGSTLNIPQYQAAGTYVTAVTASSPLASSGGTTPNITIQQASGSQNGFLSSTDWTTFNSKQNALTNPVTGTGTTNYLSKFTGTSTIGNSSLFDGGGFGGFNSTGINARTFVINAASGRPLALELFEFANVHSVFVRPNNSGFNLISSNYISGGVYLPLSLSGRENNADLVLQTSGNVTIGTTTDSGFKLDVNGTGRFFRNDSANISLTISNSFINQGNLINFIHNSNGSTTNAFIGHGGDSTGNLIFINNSIQALTIARSTGAATFSSSVTAGGGLASGNALVLSNSTNARQFQLGYSIGAGYNYFQVYDGSSFQPMMINNSIYITSGGNVGIGTSSPSERLHVSGGNIIVNSAQAFGFGDRSTQIVGNTGASGFLRFDTNNVERMIITGGGNLLVGTTTDAGYKLDVNGTGRFSASSAALSISNASDLWYNITRGSSFTNIGVDSTGSFYNTNTSHRFLTNSGSTTALTITSGGNVGIGTTSPAERLHVETSNEYQITWARTGAGKRWAIGTDTGGFYFNNRTDSVLPLYITNAGNVLIGTTTDVGAKLYVNGGIRTANPTGSTSNDWLLGRALVSGSSTPDRWIRVQIGNLYYDILAVYMGSV
jgi:hypothetical protein